MLVDLVDTKQKGKFCRTFVFIICTISCSNFQTIFSKSFIPALWLLSITLKQVPTSYKNCLREFDWLLLQLPSCPPFYFIIN